MPKPIHFLPPKEHRAHKLALAFLVLAPFAFGLLALYLGQDGNWDLRNYHWYNAYAFLNGRYAIDILPSQTPWFSTRHAYGKLSRLTQTTRSMSRKCRGFSLAKPKGIRCFQRILKIVYAKVRSCPIGKGRNRFRLCLSKKGPTVCRTVPDVVQDRFSR